VDNYSYINYNIGWYNYKMDSEEILHELTRLINVVGPAGEEIFDLSMGYQRILFFEKFRALLAQKDMANDQVALDVLNWAYQLLAE
jgi:hypothetical protein